jgi:tetratricopeptide (TPR) repeat protein
METSVKRLHQQADSLLGQGNMAEARKIYEKICEINEKDSYAWLMRGAIDGECGKVLDAISHVRKAIAIEPDADAYHTLAHLLLSQEETKEARDCLRKAVKLDPEYTEAWVMLSSVHGRLQDFTEAEACSQEALKQNNTIVEAYMTLGNALSSQGKNREAVDSYQMVTHLQPNHQAAWLRLGIVQVQLHRLDEAEKALDKALRLNPDDIQARAYRAMNIITRGDLETGVEQLQNIIRADPNNEEAWLFLKNVCIQGDPSLPWLGFTRRMTQDHPESSQAWLGLGYAQEHNDELESALESYQNAIDIRPGLHDAWNRKGIVYAKQEQFNEAQKSFEKALAYGSDVVVTHYGYGSMLRRNGWFEESEKQLRMATEKDPAWVPGYIELSRVLLDQGCFDETVAVLKQAAALDPDSHRVAIGLAEAYERMGLQNEAYNVLKPFLDREDVESQAVCVFAKLSSAIGRRDDALSKIEKILEADKNLNVHQKLNLNFRAAEIYQAQKDYDKAMEYYNRGNACKPVTYSPEKHHKFISDTMTVFNRETLAEFPHSKASTKQQPVFIVGMPRSGTSLVEQILSCHDQVYGAGELRDIGNTASKLGFHRDRSVPAYEHFQSIPQNLLEEFSTAYLTKLETLSSNEPIVTDKMPGNFIHLGLIQMLFPGARIIHIQRDPRDTCLSCYFTDFDGIHEYAYHLESLGHYYCEHKRLMEHWRNTLTIPFLDIRYEGLVSDVESVSRSLIEFCGLDWDPKVLDFYKSERRVNTASYMQVNKPIYKSSVAKWKLYDNHLAPLYSALASCTSSSRGHSSRGQA